MNIPTGYIPNSANSNQALMQALQQGVGRQIGPQNAIDAGFSGNAAPTDPMAGTGGILSLLKMLGLGSGGTTDLNAVATNANGSPATTNTGGVDLMSMLRGMMGNQQNKGI